MRKLLIAYFLLGLFVGQHYAKGQNSSHPRQQKTSSYEYYIYISGVDKRQDVVALEENIGKKEGVTYFMASRFPVKYFILRTFRPVSAIEFGSWIGNANYKVEVYGDDLYAKEKACLLYNKKNQSNR